MENIEVENPSKDEKVENDNNITDLLGNGQLVKKIITKGLPESRPERLNLCTVNICGKLEDGTVVEEYKNFIFQLGDFELVQGLDMAIALMNCQEKAEITVISRFAYGSIGLPPNIPPDATIIYDVELLDVKEEKDIESKTYDSRKEIGNKKRERGNFYFSRQDFNLAIQCYRRALEYLDESEGGVILNANNEEPTNAQLQDLLEDRIKVLNNLAISQIKIAAYDTALTSVESVLRCQPNNVKALFRKGKIYESKGDVSKAIPLLQKAATLDPDNKTIQNELSKLILKSKREARNEKDMYQKMLGHAQKLEGNKSQVNRNQATNNKTSGGNKIKLLSYTLGSVLVAVAAVSFYRYSNK